MKVKKTHRITELSLAFENEDEINDFLLLIEAGRFYLKDRMALSATRPYFMGRKMEDLYLNAERLKEAIGA